MQSVHPGYKIKIEFEVDALHKAINPTIMIKPDGCQAYFRLENSKQFKFNNNMTIEDLYNLEFESSKWMKTLHGFHIDFPKQSE